MPADCPRLVEAGGRPELDQVLAGRAGGRIGPSLWTAAFDVEPHAIALDSNEKATVRPARACFTGLDSSRSVRMTAAGLRLTAGGLRQSDALCRAGAAAAAAGWPIGPCMHAKRGMAVLGELCSAGARATKPADTRSMVPKSILAGITKAAHRDEWCRSLGRRTCRGATTRGTRPAVVSCSLDRATSRCMLSIFPQAPLTTARELRGCDRESTSAARSARSTRHARSTQPSPPMRCGAGSRGR